MSAFHYNINCYCTVLNMLYMSGGNPWRSSRLGGNPWRSSRLNTEAVQNREKTPWTQKSNIMNEGNPIMQKSEASCKDSLFPYSSCQMSEKEDQVICCCPESSTCSFPVMNTIRSLVVFLMGSDRVQWAGMKQPEGRGGPASSHGWLFTEEAGVEQFPPLHHGRLENTEWHDTRKYSLSCRQWSPRLK